MKTRPLPAIILSGVLALPLLTLDSQAQTAVAWRGLTNAATPLWNIPSNWSLNRVPSCVGTNALGDKATLNDRYQPPCFVNSLAQPSQFLVGDNNPGFMYILSGGTLTSSNYSGVNSWNALGYNELGRVEVLPGGSLVSSNHLWIGFNWNGRGNLVINGGRVDVLGMIGLGGFGGTGNGIGIVQVNGGSLNLAQWNDAQSISPLSQLDIRKGTVTITNDHTASINAYIAGGQVTGYGGVGTVTCSLVVDPDLNSTNTVLTATCPPGAGGPSPVTNGSPYAVETTFPPRINPTLMVHYWALDPPATPPNANWTPTLGLIAGGDQATTDVNFRGLSGKQSTYAGTSANFNVYDTAWPAWNTNGLIDVLLCVYGDANILRSAQDQNQPRRFTFETGVTPVNKTVYGGTFGTNAYNSQWTWILFTITNNLQADGLNRLVGSIPANATGTGTSTNYGGINGGTLRISSRDGGATGLSIRAVAFGQHGAFGTAPEINQFALPDGSCPPVVNVNLAGIDFNGVTNNLQVINDPATGQDVSFLDNVGPAGDQRKAVKPNGYYLNFGILNNYLGKPCNDNVLMKVCVDYFDDPAFAGQMVQFGPQAYTIDSLGDIAMVPWTSMATLQGTGKWIRRSWIIPNVNLVGYQTGTLTGGPQFTSFNGQVAVSRCQIGIIRNSGPLAGQDPLADCLQDPLVCEEIYGTSAEWDLQNGIANGMDVGDNSGDQGYALEVAGPGNDRRQSVSPTNGPSYYLNFRLLNEALGPVTQGNVHLAVAATYYDDPAQQGAGFRPEAWTVQQNGATATAHLPVTRNMLLQGTGKWREAYWEIGALSFDGVNQHPAATRFAATAPIHISRVRYVVVRQCGPTAGQNPLRGVAVLSAAPDTNNLVRLSWPYRAPQALLQSTPTLGGAWSPFSGTPVVEGEASVLRLGPTNAASQFFRLSLTPQ